MYPKYIILALLPFMWACGDDDTSGNEMKMEDLCEAIVCDNGDCVDGICDCEPGWHGENCDEVMIPSTTILSDLIIEIPKSPIADTWDEAGTDEGPDIIIAFFGDQDFILDELSLSDADHMQLLVTDFDGTIYTDLDFSVELNGISYYSIGLFDDEGNQMTEFMEAAYLNFEFSEEAEDPFPTAVSALGTFNQGNISFLDVNYRF